MPACFWFILSNPIKSCPELLCKFFMSFHFERLLKSFSMDSLLSEMGECLQKFDTLMVTSMHPSYISGPTSEYSKWLLQMVELPHNSSITVSSLSYKWHNKSCHHFSFHLISLTKHLFCFPTIRPENQTKKAKKMFCDKMVFFLRIMLFTFFSIIVNRVVS